MRNEMLRNEVDVLSPQMAALLPHEEEIKRRKELLAKVRTVRDGSLINRGLVVGDPLKQYVWVNVNTNRQMFFQNLGFQICRDETIQTSPLFKQSDGTYIRGDLILYEISKEVFDAMNDVAVIDGIQAIHGNQETFIGSAQGAGIPAFIPKR